MTLYPDMLIFQDNCFRADVGGGERSTPESGSGTSPEGTAELRPHAVLGVGPGKTSPAGTTGIGRDAILDNLQPSLRDSIMFLDVPRTSVLG
jgi:hypothetical protein